MIWSYALKIASHYRAAIRSWSLAHFVFDGGLTLALTTIIAWTQAMPLGVIAILVVGIGMAATGAIELSRRAIDEPGRLMRAQALIKAMAGHIPIDSQFAKVVAANVAVATEYVSGRRDWQTETVAALRAIVRSEIVSDYELCLLADSPNEPARQFLSSLSKTITLSDLRGRYSNPPPPNS